MRGHEKELFEAYEKLTGDKYEPETPHGNDIAHIKKAVQTIIEMKNVS